MAKYKIVSVEPYWEDCSLEMDIAKKMDADAVFIMTIDYDRIYEEIPDCDALVIQYLRIDDALLDRMPKCKIVVRSAIGVNNIDLEACARRGVMVANVPDYMSGEVADHIMAMFLAVNRRLVHLNRRVREGHWNPQDAKPILLLKNQAMGILGCGQIGRMVGARASSFGMKVFGHDPFLPEEEFAKHGITRVEKLEAFFEAIDHLSVHMPLNESTHHVVNYDLMRRLKPHSIVLNSSRGPVIDNADLYRVLKEGRIFGAGLDVLEVEPPEFPLPLAEFDNVLLSPHIAYYSQEGEINMKRKSFEEVGRALLEGRPKHWVNEKYFLK